MAKKSELEELFQAPAQIMKLSTMSDGGIRIEIDTSELNDPEELAKLFRLKKGATGWFLFKSASIQQKDIPDQDPELGDGETKTPSQRLRAVLFVFWKEVKGGKGSFDDFYRHTMEKYIENVKEKLPVQGEE